MYKDLVVDTHVFVDIIEQYYTNGISQGGHFAIKNFINKSISIKLNQINNNYLIEEDFRFGIVVTSIFSFVEISRQFETISHGRFSLIQFRAFLDEKPDWLYIDPLSFSLSKYLFIVPKSVLLGNEEKAIELPDAIHCATYYSRESALLATNDSRIRQIQNIDIV